MITRIAVGIAEIGRVWSGEQTLLVRSPGGMFDKVQPGAQLWLAEPFYLERALDGFAPTSARDRGARPTFAADVLQAPQAIAGTHGKRHPARSLCREWHRAHLLVRSRTDLRLQDLTEEHLANLGFRSASEFAAHWNVEAALGGVKKFQWEHNPRVLLFGFELVPVPLALRDKKEVQFKRGPQRPRPYRAAQAEPAVEEARATLAEAAQEFARRYAQPRRLSATAKNPIDLAPRPVRRVVAAPSPTPLAAATAASKPIEENPVPAFESPLLPEPSFSTSTGDHAFLAALKRERPVGLPHPAASAPAAPAALRRRQTMAPIVAATGSCPRCGTRLAYGCEHYPAAPQEAAE